MNNLQGIKYTCLLGKRARCSPTENCKHCGWEKSERERRKKHIEKHGLTLGKDGLRRLNVAEIRSERGYRRTFDGKEVSR